MFIIVNDLHSTIRVCLIRKTVSSRQNSTRQDKTVLERDIEKIFFMLENKNGILVLLMVCTLHKKLSQGLVMDKDSCFCSVPCYLFCSVSSSVSIYKSNKTTKNCSVQFPFLANQTPAYETKWK